MFNKFKDKNKIRFVTILFILILALLLIVLLNNQTSLKLENANINYSDNISYFNGNLYTANSPPVPSNFVLTTDIYYNWFIQDSIKIFIDDCLVNLTINGKNIPLSNLGSGEICINSNGYDFEIGEFLKPGFNHIIITITDFGGRYNFKIINSLKSGTYQILLAITIILLLYFSILLIKPSKLNFIIILFLLLGIFLRVAYFANVDYLTRAPDTEGHLQYIKMISESHSLPNPNACFACYSPPFYHFLSAFVLYLAKNLNIIDPFSFVYAFSLLLSIILLIYIYKILLLFFKKQSLLSYLILGLASVWPGLIIYSVAINNDILSYTLMAIGLYYLLVYSNKKKILHLTVVVILTSLAILTKLSAGVLAMTIILYLMVQALQKKITIKKYICLSSVAIILFLVSAYPAISRNMSIHGSNDSQNLIVGNSVLLEDKLRVDNSLKNFIYLDLNLYFKYPFIGGHYLNPEVRYYLNYLLKTAVVGEFTFEEKFKDLAASTLNILLLVLFAAVLIGIVITSRKVASHANIIMLIFFISSLLLHIFLRWITPYTCSQNARYIMIALVPCLVFLNNSMEYLPRKKFPILYYFMVLVIILFILASIILLFPFTS